MKAATVEIAINFRKVKIFSIISDIERMNKDDKRQSAIAKAQAENLRKFAAERALFKLNPALKTQKKDL